jgi:hypothetical protein
LKRPRDGALHASPHLHGRRDGLDRLLLGLGGGVLLVPILTLAMGIPFRTPPWQRACSR